jgi:hypothetical protein
MLIIMAELEDEPLPTIEELRHIVGLAATGCGGSCVRSRGRRRGGQSPRGRLLTDNHRGTVERPGLNLYRQ